MIGYKPIPELNKEVPMLFWSKVAFTGDVNACWNWTHTVRENKKPYGRFDIGRRNIFSAHRLAYYLQNQSDPKDFHVLHKCDNPKCCNPNHLFLGTNADNIADKVSKNRQARPKGKRGPNEKMKFWGNHICKATKEDFELMKEIYLEGEVTVSDLVVKFGVCKKTIAAWLRSNGIYVPTKYMVLNEKQVLEIRAKYIPRVYSTLKLAKEYNVSIAAVGCIINRVTWKHI